MGYELKSNTAWENREGVKITVITPAYNRAKTLQRTIDSIEKQTFNDWEYIIINDGSTDDTDAIIRAYLETSTHPVLYIKKRMVAYIRQEILDLSMREENFVRQWIRMMNLSPRR